MKEVLLCLFCWACRAGTRDFCSALAALIGPLQNIFFLTVGYFNSFVSIAQQAGQAAVLGRLSLSMVSLVESYICCPPSPQFRQHDANNRSSQNYFKILINFQL
jgi:hypothetical protein